MTSKSSIFGETRHKSGSWFPPSVLHELILARSVSIASCHLLVTSKHQMRVLSTYSSNLTPVENVKWGLASRFWERFTNGWTNWRSSGNSIYERSILRLYPDPSRSGSLQNSLYHEYALSHTAISVRVAGKLDAPDDPTRQISHL